MRFPIVLAVMASSVTANAEVTASSDAGFATHNEALVDASPAKVWAEMVKPAGWWNREHTWSGNAANLTLEPVAGGCFCERLPGGGSVQHLQVVYAAPGATLRLSGGLGPLQSEALAGTLTMTLKPEGRMTRITWDYVVGGYMRMPMAQMAPLVDQVVGEQLIHLAAKLGKVVDPAARRP